MRREGKIDANSIQKVNEILNREIDQIYFDLANKIEPEVKEHHFLPWLLAYKMEPDSARVAFMLPDEDWSPEMGEFTCSDRFAEKLGLDKSYVEEQLKTRFYSGEVMWLDKGAVTTLSSGWWIDLQNNKDWFRRNGDAYYKVISFFVEQDIAEVNQLEAEKRIKEGKMGLARIVPRYDSVKDYPDLLPAENVKEILKSRQTVVQNQCACRIRYPEFGQDEKVCLCFNNTAKLSVKMEIGQELPWEEAFDYIQRVGKVEPHCHINKHTDNLKDIGDVFCSCQADVCVMLKNATRIGTKYPAWEYYNKSRFLAVIDPEKCINCGLCAKKRCMFEAIDFRYNKQTFSEKYYVNENTCMGCGCCVETCPTKAMKMVCVQPPEFLLGYRLEENKDLEQRAHRSSTLDC